MARAVRRCFKKRTDGLWTVGKMCNKSGASTKYATGKVQTSAMQRMQQTVRTPSAAKPRLRPKKKPNLNLTRRQRESVAAGKSSGRIGKVSKTRKDGKKDKRFK